MAGFAETVAYSYSQWMQSSDILTVHISLCLHPYVKIVVIFSVMVSFTLLLAVYTLKHMMHPDEKFSHLQ